MRIAVVGAGGIAQKAYFPLLAVMPDVEIVGVHSRTQARVQDACRRWHLPNGTTHLEDILDLKPQAVLVISSTESHFDICRTLLKNKIDVYSEKSLTTSSRQSFELAKIAQEYKCILMVGYNRRYALLNKQAKEILGNRKVQLAVIQKHRTKPSNSTLFQQYLDDTIHQIDMMRFFCGEVEAESTSYKKSHNMIQSAISTVRIPGGGQGTVMICNQAGAWQENVTLHAEGLTIHIDVFRSLRILMDDHEEIYGSDRAGKWITSMKERGFYGQVAHFFECVQSRKEPLTTAKEAARTQILLEELVRASGDECIE